MSDCVLCRNSVPHVCDYSDVGHEPEDIIRALRARVAELEERLAYWESVWKGEMEWAWEDVKKHEARVAELEGALRPILERGYVTPEDGNAARAALAAGGPPAPCSCCADHKRDVGGHHPLCECACLVTRPAPAACTCNPAWPELGLIAHAPDCPARR